MSDFLKKFDFEMNFECGWKKDFGLIGRKKAYRYDMPLKGVSRCLL